ncbi:hypothetical protein [Streptomyces pseudovenezuelae]|uniref:DUF8175 domain-containing protein n=1 Tax=Streptomyces pseudovenezuelae TaxID=67350 RepID=A0ABT6LST4_9ACTN|nr:hypothetical protein [Streptomyces pseudovenezuelae]MDH6218459.1 hypothetical protein [Streptomyces pseudovenezuelae]
MFTRRERQAGRSAGQSEEPGPYWKQRSWQVSAGFLGIVFVVGGIAALTSGPGDQDDRGSQVTVEGPLSGDPAPANGRPRGCRTDDSAGDALPEAAPKDVEWRPLGVSRVPVSGTAGPTRIEKNLWWCFAHTPTGAALAAHVIPSQMSGSGWRTVAGQQVVAGRGRDLFEFTRATVQDTDVPDGSTPVASYAGFTVTSYTTEAATVRLLMKTDQGYAATAIALRWSGGDWKVLPGEDGSLHSKVSTVQGPGGFVLWGS